jgi:ABC-2 type transport system ATP-binding protein
MLIVDNIKFAYPKQNYLFDNLSLELKKGGIYGLLGKNGAGKTTLLSLLSGVLFPDYGSISLLNMSSINRSRQFLQEVYLLTDTEFAKPQNLTGNEYLKAYASFYPRFDYNKFDVILKEWAISSTKKLTQFSSGEYKKFLLSFALASNCSLLLLDEPTNGLDIPAKVKFRSLVANTITEDSSIIISSHQVRDLEDLIDPIIILDQGQIILNQSIAEIENKITFTTSTNKPAPGTTLYTTPVVNGFTSATIRHNDEKYTKVDLEILFSAVINNPKLIQSLWSDK